MTVDRSRLRARLADEEARFVAAHPKCRGLHERAIRSLLSGVPMNWMVRFPGAFPLFVERASGSRFTDADGLDFLDLCLGDTGAMTGHARADVAEAIAAQARRGLTFMLPTEDAAWVGEELARRFGLPLWQLALTATDANRFAIRLARHVTGRPKVLVFNWCYHGTVDETFVTLQDGREAARAGNIGPPVDPAVTTRVVEFNDVAALERALAPRDVACVLAEPAMTNIGIVHPEPGYHDAVRRITRETGTILILDETHTISAGPGGYTAAHGLSPDVLTIGKPIAGGVPAAVYGMTSELGERVGASIRRDESDTGGIGGTLAGNALSLAAMRVTLERLLTPETYARTIPLAERFADGVAAAIRDFGLPWSVTRLGCRAEYWFRALPPRNGSEAAASVDGELDRYMHLAALNRGVLMTPFHNMALIGPDTTEADVDRHTAVFRESIEALR
ncbi:MAG TPA: aspartate aminotransferase family protein [Thermoanaerobaculia bacterium]|jgi:glutamate-1-semialdehyde 2,1-aminomutase|nr:aspartate aminotransferase family protein [Thermoanaerobaculia bacterium]